MVAEIKLSEHWAFSFAKPTPKDPGFLENLSRDFWVAKYCHQNLI